jgi:penicillin amidase
MEGGVELAGLEGSVEVLRDRFGAPRIFASTERDPLFARGYVHAQNPLLQLEPGRRTAAVILPFQELIHRLLTT